MLINILTGLAYLALAGFLIHRIQHPQKDVPEWSKWLPFVPAALHVYSLYLAIETGNGQNLSLLNTLSLTGFIIVVLIAVYRFRHPTPHLMLYTAIFAGIVVLLSLTPEKPQVLPLKGNTIGILHIWLSVISFSLLLAAALQSVLVLVLNKKLKSRPAAIHPLLPPLLQMEQFLLDLVLAGVITLGAALVLGFMLPSEVLAEQSLHKIILSALAWFSFCTFLIGYKTSKLSGIRFARLTIIAFIILTIGFVGSKLVLEYILQRG
ncbi:MAG: cytochrome c biogenesis protein CcsA [Kangiellaceae bacterium]|nr:cytochrome c biogenesis protein CcsA [Kangiellaceae bacterium]